MAFKKTDDALKKMVDNVVEGLQKGIVPWKRMWQTSSFPKNLISKKGYRGWNIFYLCFIRMKFNYSSPWFLTRTQVFNLWGYDYDKATKSWKWRKKSDEPEGQLDMLLKGGWRKSAKEKGHIVVYWLWHTFDEKDENGEKTGKKIRYPKVIYYYVYNTDQVNLPDWKEEKIVPDMILREWSEQDQVEAAEEIIKGFANVTGGPKYEEIRSDRAFYAPREDRVVVPLRGQFTKLPEFYSTAFHELGHATGHADRLNRKGITDLKLYNLHQYGEEELVAEMTASLLCAECGFEEETMGNSSAYLAHWVKKIQEDPKILWQAAQRAQKAADLILGREPEKEDQNEEDAA